MKKIATAITATAIAAGALVAAPAASADTCRESLWGTDIWGNRQFDCSDGRYTLKRPLLNDSWDDPFATYELQKKRGSRKDTMNCRYSSWKNGYDCTSTYRW